MTTGALDTVIGVLERHAEVGVVGPRLERADGSLDHAARRSFPTPLSALGHFSGLGRRAGASGPLAAYRAPEVESGPVDAVNGAFMLMRRSVFEAAGGFDEDYWMYMEDLDLSYRLAKEGWRSWYEPTATVMHVKGGTVSGERPPRLNWHFHRGMYRSTATTTRPIAPQRSTRSSTPESPRSWRPQSLRRLLRRSLARLRQRRRTVLHSDGGLPSTSGDG